MNLKKLSLLPKKQNLIFVNFQNCFSGGEIVLSRLVNELSLCNNFNITVFSDPIFFKNTKLCKNIKIHTIIKSIQLNNVRGIGALIKIFLNFIYTLILIIKIIISKKPDIIHCNSLTTALYCSFFCYIFNIKMITHSHEIREGFLYYLVHRYISYCSTVIICVSNAVIENWASHGVSSSKTCLLYNGIPD